MSNDAVLIAQDVLQRLDSGYLNTWPGNYLDRLWTNGTMPIFPRGDLQPIIDEVEAHCKVCAIGSMLLSYIRLKDSVTGEQLHNALIRRDPEGHDAAISKVVEYITGVLKNVFPIEQLALIEAAYESDCMPPIARRYLHTILELDATTPQTTVVPVLQEVHTEACRLLSHAKEFDRQLEAARHYCSGHIPAARLRMIMQNIIDNDGTFKPELAKAQT